MSHNSTDETGSDNQLNSTSDTVVPLRKPVKCPGCGKPSSRDTYPFCSKRCSDVDLGRWFNGTYTFSQDEPDDLG